ncbi:type II/IV secretion system domain protein, partial [Acinetobacter baumannii]|nr:type II/IV secretion system domain protein [Acinetobacter baumannii]
MNAITKDADFSIKKSAQHDYLMLCHPSINLEMLNIAVEEDIRKILTVANYFKASDLFILSGAPVLIRRYGKIYAVTHHKLKSNELGNFLTILNGSEALSSIKKGRGLNFAYACSEYSENRIGGGFTAQQGNEGKLTVASIAKSRILFRCNVSA